MCQTGIQFLTFTSRVPVVNGDAPAWVPHALPLKKCLSKFWIPHPSTTNFLSCFTMPLLSFFKAFTANSSSYDSRGTVERDAPIHGYDVQADEIHAHSSRRRRVLRRWSRETTQVG
jgi:hypothetical protein